MNQKKDASIEGQAFDSKTKKNFKAEFITDLAHDESEFSITHSCGGYCDIVRATVGLGYTGHDGYRLECRNCHAKIEVEN